MKHYEYATIKAEHLEMFSVALNGMGKLGWEAIACYMSFDLEHVAVLKREVPVFIPRKESE